MVANLLFFAITLIAFFMQQKALKNSNPNVFVRSVMGGMMIKMAICIVAVFVYAFAFKESFNKRTILAAMFLYLIYLAAEVLVATKLNKQINA
jgi:cation transporter-like permease